MATLSSELGIPLEELDEEQITDFIENLRARRQIFTDSAYETRQNRRQSAAKAKRTGDNRRILGRSKCFSG